MADGGSGWTALLSPGLGLASDVANLSSSSDCAEGAGSGGAMFRGGMDSSLDVLSYTPRPTRGEINVSKKRYAQGPIPTRLLLYWNWVTLEDVYVEEEVNQGSLSLSSLSQHEDVGKASHVYVPTFYFTAQAMKKSHEEKNKFGEATTSPLPCTQPLPPPQAVPMTANSTGQACWSRLTQALTGAMSGRSTSVSSRSSLAESSATTSTLPGLAPSMTMMMTMTMGTSPPAPATLTLGDGSHDGDGTSPHRRPHLHAESKTMNYVRRFLWCHHAHLVSHRHKMRLVQCHLNRNEEDAGDDDGPLGWQWQRMNGGDHFVKTMPMTRQQQQRRTVGATKW
ncbi:hypothetical protein EDB89DRAFT_1901141 [Lactarius sanguifluus]|nr:hypothetical protein EDB89DRAFT_1901141 [Lactarius sanguifluus]